jgi:hypothetical protein
MLLMAPSILSMLTPIAGRTRPMFNVTVSNVPGPPRPLYFRGARLQASYPISLIAHGIGLNITCQSYADAIAFAFVGCRDTLPHLQNLAVYTAEAFDALESAQAGAAARAAKPARGRRAPRRKAAVPAPAAPAKAARRPARRSK